MLIPYRHLYPLLAGWFVGWLAGLSVIFSKKRAGCYISMLLLEHLLFCVYLTKEAIFLRMTGVRYRMIYITIHITIHICNTVHM